MKKYLLMATCLMMVATQSLSFAQTGGGSSGTGTSEPETRTILVTTNYAVNFPAEPEVSAASPKKESIRSEGDLDEAKLAEMPYDAFLSEAGYVVYPIEENGVKLQKSVSKNPMVLRREFISRRVHLVRRVDFRGTDGIENSVLGKQFMIVSEIGSTHNFMVNLKDLHFVQNKDEILDNPR